MSRHVNPGGRPPSALIAASFTAMQTTRRAAGTGASRHQRSSAVVDSGVEGQVAPPLDVGGDPSLADHIDSHTHDVLGGAHGPTPTLTIDRRAVQVLVAPCARARTVRSLS